jgi:hypothetical protein
MVKSAVFLARYTEFKRLYSYFIWLKEQFELEASIHPSFPISS